MKVFGLSRFGNGFLAALLGVGVLVAVISVANDLLGDSGNAPVRDSEEMAKPPVMPQSTGLGRLIRTKKKNPTRIPAMQELAAPEEYNSSGKKDPVLGELSDLEVSELSRENLSSIPVSRLGNELLIRGSVNPGLKFIDRTLGGGDAAMDALLLEIVASGDASEESLGLAREELMLLRQRLKDIWSEEKGDPRFINSCDPAEGDDAIRKYYASWFGLYGRIHKRSLPLLEESERIIFGILQVPFAENDLFGIHD